MLEELGVTLLLDTKCTFLFASTFLHHRAETYWLVEICLAFPVIVALVGHIDLYVLIFCGLFDTSADTQVLSIRSGTWGSHQLRGCLLFRSSKLVYEPVCSGRLERVHFWAGCALGQ